MPDAEIRRYTKDEVLSEMHPVIREWFNSKFEELTEPQAYAIPVIHKKKSVLVSSPTGSGKTITAFLSIINNLFEMGEEGKLEDKIYCVYISPLKALANDIHRNLEVPLEEIYALAKSKGMKVPKIRTAIRSGDTSQSERQRMARKPPHIFITTPESLSLVLTSPKFRERFRDVRYVIVDEIHEISGSKRGSMLSVNLERLQNLSGPLIRIGLSATQAPIEMIAEFLGGYSGSKPRKVHIIEVRRRKDMDLRVLSPVPDITAVPYEIANERAYEIITKLINEHRTTIVFTNTRSATEHVAYKLKERGIDAIEAHHGSMSKERRLDVEEKLKKGELKAVVTSTSLELGIDIGYVDLVIQIGSPKSIAKGLQRIGRSGHAIGAIPKGRFIAFQNDDLVECAVLVKSAYDGLLDRVDIPKNPLDVLAQTIVGMSLEERWNVDDAFKLIKRSYSFHTLNKEDFLSVLNYLSGRSEEFYSKIWYDPDEKVFGKKKGSRMIYFLNSGTIPEDANYRVFSETGSALGKLSEKFVERLSPGDIFVLGGRSYEFVRIRGMKVYVRDAKGKSPTVPSWTGEMLPRSFDLSLEIGKFREKMFRWMKEMEEGEIIAMLVSDYHMTDWAARSIYRYFTEQDMAVGIIPTHENLLIEEYRGEGERWHYIFHYPFGRRVNDALSRAISYRVSRMEKMSASVTVTDDSFMVTVPRRIDAGMLGRIIGAEYLEKTLKEAIRGSELFAQRFRHCATRALAVLRNYRGKDISVGRQRRRSARILDYLGDYEDFPVIKETYNEIFNIVMDLPHAKQVLRWIEERRAVIGTIHSEIPSPFASNVLLSGISDIVSMEDKSALLREFHRKLLEKILPEEELRKFMFDEKDVRGYFRNKFGIEEKEGIIQVLKKLGALNVLSQHSRNIFDYCAEIDKCREWAEELIAEGKIVSVWAGGLLWTVKEYLPEYAAAYAKDIEMTDMHEKILDFIKKGKGMREIVNEFGAEGREGIRELERAYMVERALRDGDMVFVPRGMEKPKNKRILESLVYRYLEGFAPATLGEIAHALALETDDVRRALKPLMGEGIVEKGFFVIGDEEQYMLSRDVYALKMGKEGMGEEQIRSYRLKKFFDLDTIDDYFDIFGEASRTYDIFYHVRNFDWDEWRDRRERNEIMMGKFVRGRVKYVRGDEAPMFVGAFRDVRLTEFDLKVLDVIRRKDGISAKELSEMLGNAEAVKNSLQRLDSGCYIVRKYLPGEGWQSRNVFIPSDVEPMPAEKARKELIYRFIGAHGPVPMAGIKGYTGFSGTEIGRYLRELVKEGKITPMSVQGEREDFYITPEDLASLRKEKFPQDGVRILSLFDPYIAPLWSEIASKYGERWIFPIIKNGLLDGYAEIWPMSGRVEVREIETSDLDSTLKAMEKVREYYEGEGIDITTITRLRTRGIDEIGDDAEIFRRNGYVRIQDTMVKGEVRPESFELDDILRYMLYRQGICNRRFYDIFHLIDERGWVRGDYDAFLRVRNYRPLSRYRDGDIVSCKVIPHFVSYTMLQKCALYQTAKSRTLDENDEIVLQVIGRERRKKDITGASPLGPKLTAQSIDRLYEGSYIAKDMRGRFIRVFPRKYIKDARKKVLKSIIENYGFVSAELLYILAGGEYKMGEIRDLLKEMGKELVRGFFIKGSRTVYWAPEYAISEMEMMSCRVDAVIPKDDPAGWYIEHFARDIFGFSPAVSIFVGGRLTGAVRGRKSGKRIQIREFVGGSTERYLLKDYARKWGIKLDWGVDEVDEWEIMQSIGGYKK